MIGFYQISISQFINRTYLFNYSQKLYFNTELFPNLKLIEIEPEFVVLHHTSEIVCISGNKSSNLLASIDKECVLIIQSLTSGAFLNKIVLSPVCMTVQAMWLNTHGYVCMAIKCSASKAFPKHAKISKHKEKELCFIQSVSINGDFVGIPCFNQSMIEEIKGDTAVTETGQSINCLSGKLEYWCPEDLNLTTESVMSLKL